MKQHLQELSSLVRSEVARERLLSLEETRSLLENLDSRVYAPKTAFIVSYGTRLSAAWSAMVRRLEERNPSNVYVQTSLSRDCGLLRPVPLLDVRWDADLFAIEGEILDVGTCDSRDSLLVDMTIDERGMAVLEVELRGPNWGTVSPTSSFGSNELL